MTTRKDATRVKELQRALEATPKRLENHFLMCDSLGSALFDRISRQPAYYSYHQDLKLIACAAPTIANLVGKNATLVDIGCGMCRKSAYLIEALDTPSAFYALDIDAVVLGAAKQELEKTFPDVPIVTRVADFAKKLPLPRGERLLGLLAGGTIAVYSDADAGRIMQNCLDSLGRNGILLISFDTNQDSTVTTRQYTDTDFKDLALNALPFMNKAFGADFDPDTFVYECRWNEEEKQVEHILVSQANQTIHVDGKEYNFQIDEPMQLSYGKKRSLEQFTNIVEGIGGTVRHAFYDDLKYMCLVWIEAQA